MRLTAQVQRLSGVDISICVLVLKNPVRAPFLQIGPTEATPEAAGFAGGTTLRTAQFFGLPGSAKTMIVGAPGLRSIQKFDGLPDATATYCLPPTA